MGSVIGWWAESFTTVITRARALSTQIVAEHPYVSNVATRMPLLRSAITGQHPYVSNVACSMRPMSTALSVTEMPQAQVITQMRQVSAALTAAQGQEATVSAAIRAVTAAVAAAQVDPVSATALIKKAQTAIAGAQAQSSSVSSALLQALSVIVASGDAAGYDAIGTGVIETTGALSCSVSPIANGDDVIAFVTLGVDHALGATYGASNLKMTLLGRVVFKSGSSVTAYRIHSVPSGSATIHVSRSGSGWGQVQAVAYRSVSGCKVPKVATGTGTALSQVVTVPASGRTVQSFGTSDSSTPLSSLSGGTNRYLDNSGFVTQSIGDTNTAATFAATASSSIPWGSIAVPLTVSQSGPVISDVNWSSGEGIGASTFDLICSAGDYVYVDVHQGGNNTPSVIQCAGTTMTLVDSQVFNSTYSIRRYRIGPLATGGTKTVNATVASNWSRIVGVAVSGMTAEVATTKTSGTGSQPSHAVALTANQLALQVFGLSAAMVSTVAGANIFDNPGGSTVFPYMAIADESTTFALGNTSVNWGSMITVLS